MTRKPQNPTGRARLPSALALTLALALAYGILLTGAMPVGTDHTLLYSPFFSHPWDDGPPLWQAGVLSGAPLHDNLQAALLYPPRWPFFFLPDGQWPLYCGPLYAIHYAIALAGTFLLARRLALSHLAAVAAAVVFAMGGHMAGRIINPTIFFASCWLPWLLAGAVRRRRAAALTLLAAAMIFTTGSPHLMLYGAAAYALLFILLQSRPPQGAARAPALLRAAAPRVVAFLLAGVFASPVLIPGVLRAGRSIRQEAGAASNLADSVEWSEIPGVFLGGGGGLIHPEYIDKSCYLGPVCILLIVGLLVRRRAWRDRRVAAAVALSAAGLFLALGRNVGLDVVMPWIPFYRRLAGPSRALVLTALGAALLTGLALDAMRARPRRRPYLPGAVLLGFAFAAASVVTVLTWNSHVPGGRPPWTDDWAAPWLRAPCSTQGALFMLIDATFLLTAAGLLFLVTARRPRLRRVAVTALVFLGLWHFMPRVAPPLDTPALLEAPATVRFLQECCKDAPHDPFRIAGYDALRLHDAETHSPWFVDFAVPNLAVLYGLEDIQGFDPLIQRRYARLIETTAGRAPFNDPIRNLDIARPDPLLFDILGVRFIIGHPRNRRLTTLPMTLDPLDTWREVQAWRQVGPVEERPLTHWLFVSLIDASQSGARLEPGEEVARLHVVAREGRFSLPVRAGVHTADMFTPNRLERMSRPGFQAVPYALWSFHQPAPVVDHEIQVANWRGCIAFPQPLHVQRVFWELTRQDIVLNIAGQAFRLAPDPTREPWRLASGSEDDVAPVFEYTRATSRAFLTPREAREVGGEGLSLTTETLRGRAGLLAGDVRWVERRTNSFRLAVRSPAPAWLVLRERWHPGWRARVNGEPAPVLAVNGLLRAVAVPRGASDLRMVFRPRLAGWLLVAAAATLLVALAAVGARRGNRRGGAATGDSSQ